MILKRFNNKIDLEKDMVQRIHLILKSAIQKYGNANILLSGGTTPKFLYEALAELPLDWTQIQVGLVDERFVEKGSDFSNASLIEGCFLKAAGFKLLPMVNNIENLDENLKQVNLDYQPFLKRIDYCLLGMGEDGHTASLFPGDQASEKSLNGMAVNVLQTIAPAEPKIRISCSKEMLRNAQFIDLLIVGRKKLNIFQSSSENHLPIAALMNESTDGVTYFAEN
jgi:6-phosphogluconolactonase